MSNAGSNIPVDANAPAGATPVAGNTEMHEQVGHTADQLPHDLAADAWGTDPATGSLIGDSIAAGDADGDLSELHAALASLSGDAFAYLDIALDHLTSSSDLFDVPAMDHGDFGGDLTGS